MAWPWPLLRRLEPDHPRPSVKIEDVERLASEGRAAELEALAYTSMDRKTLAGLFSHFTKHSLLPVTAMTAGLASREALNRLGFDTSHVLYANALCPDEVNRKGPWWDLLLGAQSKMTFNLGGLGGLPAVGKTGFEACASHASDTADKAAIFVVCGSHVGVDCNGCVGAVVRERQAKRSSPCCGAACAALQWARSCEPFLADANDPQMDAVKRVVLDRLCEVKGNQVNLAECMATACFEKVCELIPGHLNHTVPVVVLGGIQLNTEPGVPDYFAPRYFVIFPRQATTYRDSFQLFDRTLSALMRNN